jgi:hypothetical protein
MRYFLILVTILTLSIGFMACSSNLEPIEVVSVTAVGPVNPGGPTIEISLKNVSNESIVSIKCILQLDGERTFDIDFPEVSTATPLQPVATTSQTLNIIGPTGYSDEVFYPLMISVKLLNSRTFSYVRQVQVK